MTKVSPVTAQMIALAFLKAPEIKYIYRIFVLCIWAVRNWLVHFNRPTRGQLLISLWALSHFICICGTLLYLASRNSIWYYVGLIGAFSTYTLMVMRHLFILLNGFRQQAEGSPLLWMIKSENFTLLSMATVNLISPISVYKMGSFSIYSLLNFSNFVVQRLGNSTWHKVLMPIIVQVEPSMLAIAIYIDMVALLTFAYEFCAGKGALTSFLVFGVILLMRLDQSAVAASCHHQMIRCLLSLTSHFRLTRRIHHMLLFVEEASRILLHNGSHASSIQDYESPQPKSRIALSVFVPMEVIKDM